MPLKPMELPAYQPEANQDAAAGQGNGGLVEELRRESVRLGFSRLGVAPAGPPPRQDLVRRWLDQGFAGVLREWFERQQPLRADT